MGKEGREPRRERERVSKEREVATGWVRVFMYIYILGANCHCQFVA
jgi:hypothetical protein